MSTPDLIRTFDPAHAATPVKARRKRKQRRSPQPNRAVAARAAVTAFEAAHLEARLWSDRDVAHGIPVDLATLDRLEAEVVAQAVGGRPRRTTKGRTYDPDPIRVEDVALALAHCLPLTPGRAGYLSAMRLRGLIAVLYRTGVRISEALDFEERDIEHADRVLIVRHGKGDKRRPVLIDEWGWDELRAWLTLRDEIPPGKLFPIVRGRHAGEAMAATDVRRQFRDLQARAGIRRRFRPHQLRHGWAVENLHEGTNMLAIQRQLGHAHLGVTEVYFRGIDPLTLLEPIGARPAPRIVIPPPMECVSA